MTDTSRLAKARNLSASLHTVADLYLNYPRLAQFTGNLQAVDLMNLTDTDEITYLVETAIASGFTVTSVGMMVLFSHGPITYRAYVDGRTVSKAQLRAAVANALHDPGEGVEWSGTDEAGYLARCLDGCQAGLSTPTRDEIIRWGDAHDCDDGRDPDPETAHAAALAVHTSIDPLASLTAEMRALILSHGNDPAALLEALTSTVRTHIDVVAAPGTPQ